MQKVTTYSEIFVRSFMSAEYLYKIWKERHMQSTNHGI